MLLLIITMKRKIKIGILKQKNPMKKVKQPKEYREKIKLAALRINKISPDLYLMHPREGREIIDLLEDHFYITYI